MSIWIIIPIVLTSLGGVIAVSYNAGNLVSKAQDFVDFRRETKGALDEHTAQLQKIRDAVAALRFILCRRNPDCPTRSASEADDDGRSMMR